jgi:acyl-ACP thioesterase
MESTDKNRLSLTKYFTVTSADTDMFGRLKLSKLCDYLIQSAISSADNLGFGLKFLQKEQLFWVLSRLTVIIEKQLNWYDELETETWPKTIEGPLYIRDFIVRDKKQNIVSKGTSGWLAVDAKTVRPKIINGIITDVFYSLKDKHAVKELPEKIPFMENGEKTEIQTVYFDFDINKHVTTTRYIDWIMNQFTIDFHEKNYPKKLHINFLKEIKPNEKIQLLKNNLANNSFHFEAVNLNSMKQSFRSRLEF